MKTLAVALLAGLLGLLTASAVRADVANLADGKTVQGKLRLQDGRLFLVTPAHKTFRLDQAPSVHLPADRVTPLRAAVVHRLTLADGGRLTGELLGLDKEIIRFRPAWTGPLTIPRSAAISITQLPGFLTFADEDFENGLKAWTATGKARLSDQEHASGKWSLVLDAPDQSAAYSLAEPLAPGRVGINFYDANNTKGSRWLVEADFGDAKGARTVRVIVADDGGNYTAEIPQSETKVFPMPRSAGWHRLIVEFAPQMLLVSIDDDLLYVSRRQGPGGSLRRIRLACREAGGKHRGAVFFDDLGLARAVESLRHERADPTQDELWLASGDQVLGSVSRADRRSIDLEARFGARPWKWGNVRAIFFRRQAPPLRTTQGEHVTVWLRTGAGPEPDTITGQVRRLDDRRLTLYDPILGELSIDLGRLRGLRWDFHGRRIELDRGPHHLGPEGKRVSGLEPARAEGLSLRRTFRLEAVPAAVELRVAVVHLKGMEDAIAGALREGELRTEVVVNGRVVDHLNRHVRKSPREPRWLTIALPRSVLRAGENTVLLRQTPEKRTMHYESCGVTGMVVEIPR
jgi:hypothetical protein